MSKYSCVLFDWDGTLACTLDIWVTAFKKALNDYNIVLPEDEIAYILATTGFGSTSLLDINDSQDFYSKVVKSAHALLNNNIKLYPDAYAVLKELKDKGIKLGLVTNSDNDFICSVFNTYQLDNLFDYVVTSDMVLAPKPAPDGILHILNALEESPNTTLYVGDMFVDVKAAQASGVDSALFYPEENNKYQDDDCIKDFNPTYVVKTLKALLALVF